MEEKKDELIFARHVIRKEVKGNKESITMFFGADSVDQLLNIITEAKANGNDGVTLSVLMGEHAKGLFAGVSSRGLEARPMREKPYTENKAPAPQAKTGGYTPNKRPGYSNSRWSK